MGGIIPAREGSGAAGAAPAAAAPRPVDELAWGAVVVVLYLGAAAWAVELSPPGPSLIWFPPAGVAIVATYLRPRAIVAIFVAELISTPFVVGSDAFAPLALVVNSAVLAGAYAIGGWLLRRLALDPRLRTPEDLGVLAIGIGVGSAAATVAGVAVQQAFDIVAREDLWREAGIFFVGDIVGATCVAPILVLIGAAARDGTDLQVFPAAHLPRWRLLLELTAPALVALLVIDLGEPPLRFVSVAFVPLVILAVRWGVVAATLGSILVCAVTTAGAAVQIDEVLSRADYQVLLLVLTVSAVAAGVVTSSRRDVELARKRVVEIIEATPDVVASASRDGSVRYVNPAGRALLGFTPETAGTARAFDFLPDDLAAELVREGMREAERTGSWSGENRLLGPDGRPVPVSQVLIVHPDPGDDGQPLYSTVCRDLTVRRDLEEQLRRAALFDEATGLPNRVLLGEQLARILETAEPDERSAVIFLDIDHLQRVNEAFGFEVGDGVVVELARRVGALVRGEDLVARHGGTRFVIVLESVPDELTAIRLAERLIEACGEALPVGDQELVVSTSAGITLTEAGQSVDDGLRAAEIALHRAREAGGGRVALFDREMEARAQRRREIEADLREVLRAQTWTLAYQPIFEVEERRMVGLEALLRWTHPERGPVPPFELIRLAEDTGTIVSLGREIFRRACDDAARWHAMGFPLPVSINVSARQLREPSFVDDVREVLAETAIAPELLIIELTETLLASREHGEIATLDAVRALGCRVALDDFGTGYSSLGELRDLPIDVVKLDQVFISDLPDSTTAAAMVEAVVLLATALDLVVVAEGVEQDEQVDALSGLGCHRAQGFALARPVPAHVITGMLLDSREANPARPTHESEAADPPSSRATT